MRVPSTRRIEVELRDLEALLERLKSSVGEKDYELLERFLASFAYLTELIEDRETTIGRLRKILFGSKSEKSKDVLEAKGTEEPAAAASGAAGEGATQGGASGSTPAHAEAEKEEAKPAGHGRNGAEAYEGAERIEVPHATLEPGDDCPNPGCKGRVYRLKEPGLIVRV